MWEKLFFASVSWTFYLLHRSSRYLILVAKFMGTLVGVLWKSRFDAFVALAENFTFKLNFLNINDATNWKIIYRLIGLGVKATGYCLMSKGWEGKCQERWWENLTWFEFNHEIFKSFWSLLLRVFFGVNIKRDCERKFKLNLIFKIHDILLNNLF